MKRWVVSLLLLSLSARADWVRTGLAGGPVLGLFADGSFLLAKSSRGFFRSFDHGGTWDFAPADFEASTLAAIGPVLFASGSNNAGQNIWRSRDSARTWTRMVPVADPGSGPSPINTRKLYACGRYLLAAGDTSIFRSSDLGNTWTRSAISGGHVFGVQSFGASGPYLFAGAYGIILRSADSGATWKEAGALPGSEPKWIGSFAGDGQILIAIGLGGFRSTDQGTTWSAMPDFPADRIYNSLANQGSAFVAAGRPNSVYDYSDSVYRSLDHGASWQPVGRIADGPGTGFATDGDGLLVGTGTGLYRSEDKGGTWTRIGVPGATVGTLAAYGGKAFAGMVGDPYLYATWDRGGAWAPSLDWRGPTADRPGPSEFGIASLGSDIYAFQSFRGILSRLREGAVTWEAVSVHGNVKRIWRVGQGLYANAYIDTDAVEGFYRYTGTAWMRLAGKAPGSSVVGLGPAFFSPKGSVVYRRADAETAWVPCSPDLGAIAAMAATDDAVFAASAKGLFRSPDTGRTWGLALDAKDLNALCAVGAVGAVGAGGAAGSVLIAGGATRASGVGDGRIAGLSFSLDGGASWTSAGEGLSPVPITALAVEGADLYVGTDGGGVWRRSLSELGVSVSLPRGRNRRGVALREGISASGGPRFEATGRRVDRKGALPSASGAYFPGPSRTHP